MDYVCLSLSVTDFQSKYILFKNVLTRYKFEIRKHQYIQIKRFKRQWQEALLVRIYSRQSKTSKYSNLNETELCYSLTQQLRGSQSRAGTVSLRLSEGGSVSGLQGGCSSSCHHICMLASGKGKRKGACTLIPFKGMTQKCHNHFAHILLVRIQQVPVACQGSGGTAGRPASVVEPNEQSRLGRKWQPGLSLLNKVQLTRKIGKDFKNERIKTQF